MLKVQFTKQYLVHVDDEHDDSKEIAKLATLCLVPYEEELTTPPSYKKENDLNPLESAQRRRKKIINSMLERELVYTERMFNDAHQLFSIVSSLIYRRRREADKLNNAAILEEYDLQLGALMKLQKIFRAHVASDERVA